MKMSEGALKTLLRIKIDEELRRDPPDEDLLNALVAELNRLAVEGLERDPQPLGAEPRPASRP
jgi:hypothetical protein